MGTISSPSAIYGLTAIGTPTKTQVTGPQIIGVPQASLNLTGATKAYCVSATLATASDTLTIDTATGIATVGTAPVAQVETATAAGTISGTGNAAVVVTGARITGSPITLAVAVTSGDTASVWAGKVRTALNANAAITSKYTVGGSTTAITLTEIDPQNNDTTLNISLDNGTCTGITTAATSANTTAGVGGVKLTNNTGDGKDFEGVSLGTMQPPLAILVRSISGGFDFEWTGDTLAGSMIGPSCFNLFYGGGSGTAFVISATTAACEVEVTFIV